MLLIKRNIILKIVEIKNTFNMDISKKNEMDYIKLKQHMWEIGT
jgi:hypothetical protein